MSFVVDHKGEWEKTRSWLEGLTGPNSDIFGNLDRFGQMGVEALSASTPKDSGLTASSWGYRITDARSGKSISWFNTNINQGEEIAVLIQYGHGTGTGGYVAGIDYINPALEPVIAAIKAEIGKGG